MQTIYRDALSMLKKAETNFVCDCLTRIKKVIESYQGSHIQIGNTFFIIVNDTIYVSINKGELIKFYSEEGWDTPEAIANWADTIEDYDNSRKAGNTKYSVMWNIKTEK